MDNYYGPPISQEELRQQLAAQHPSRLDDASLASGADTLMAGVDSLDDIIRDNSHELQRRRSVPLPFPSSLQQDSSDRRDSMIEFGSPSDRLQGFQFGGFDSAASNAPYTASGTNSLGLDAQTGVVPMSNPPFPDLSPDVMGNLMTFPDLDMGRMTADAASTSLFNSPDMANQFPSDSIDHASPDFPMDDVGGLGSAGMGQVAGLGLEGEDDMMGIETPSDAAAGSSAASQGRQSNPKMIPPLPAFPSAASAAVPTEPSGPAATAQASAVAAQNSLQGRGGRLNQSAAPLSATNPSTTVAGPAAPPETKQKNVYSRSGFDMLKALWRVATREHPEVHLGAVDMSCAFVVCDVTLNDHPIIYVSDNFQNLTGYNRHEILGQNCRFLQAPDGRVEAGSKREFVENTAVYNIKAKLDDRKEAQQSLINYRKGGKPFLNLITIIPIPWDTEEFRYFVGFQIDLVECPDAISGQDTGGVKVNYMHSDIGQYIWTPPTQSQWEPEKGQTLGVDDVSALLHQHRPRGPTSDWHRQSWDKMLLENVDDVVHVLSLKGLFLYLSPSCKKILEYDGADLVGTSLSSICHPSDIVPVTRELKDTAVGKSVNFVFRICRKQSGYTWFESRGSLFVEQGKGRKCIILIGRKHPVFALHRKELDANGGIGDSEIWTKLSTSGIFLFVSSNVRSLLDLLPETLHGTSIQDLMRKESRPEFGRAMEKARRGKTVTCKHEVQNKRGQVLQAQTTLYPGDAVEGSKASFLLAQTRLLKASSRNIAPASAAGSKPTSLSTGGYATAGSSSPSVNLATSTAGTTTGANSIVALGRLAAGPLSAALPPAAGGILSPGSQEAALASDDNIFDELKTTRCTSWQFELRQMEKVNRLLAEELAQLLSSKKKRKRRKGAGNTARDCANCHTRNTPEWRRGPSGNRDLCNSCGLRWAKQIGRVSPRNSSRGGGTADNQSEKSGSPLHREVSRDSHHSNSNANNSNNPANTPRSDSSRSSSLPVTPSHGATGMRSTSGSDASRPGGSKVGSGSTAAAAAAEDGGSGAASGAFSNPPQSQPLLAGGSGVGGGGMEMTAINEEQSNE